MCTRCEKWFGENRNVILWNEIPYIQCASHGLYVCEMATRKASVIFCWRAFGSFADILKLEMRTVCFRWCLYYSHVKFLILLTYFHPPHTIFNHRIYMKIILMQVFWVKILQHTFMNVILLLLNIIIVITGLRFININEYIFKGGHLHVASVTHKCEGLTA